MMSDMSMAIPAANVDTTDEGPVERALREGAYRDAVALSARLHGAPLGRLCMAMLGSQAEAEECVQEVLIAAEAAFKGYRGEGSVRAFLFGIARRMCARKLEQRGRREAHLRAVQGPRADLGTPEHTLLLRQRAERVRGALERLKPTERDAVVLRYQAGLDYREIAAACGIDEPAARKRVSRGLARMKDLLGEDAR